MEPFGDGLPTPHTRGGGGGARITDHGITCVCANQVYFTDGTCIHPNSFESRLSAWAVIRDVALNPEQALAMTKNALQLKEPCPRLRCTAMGLTPGRQSISRAQLSAVIVACEDAQLDQMASRVDIYTDSQYVVNVCERESFL